MRKLFWENVNELTGEWPVVGTGSRSSAFWWQLLWFLSFYSDLKTQEVISDVNTLSHTIMRLPSWLSGKKSACQAGATGLITGSWKSPGEEMAASSSILAGEIPWSKESMRSQNSWTWLKQLNNNHNWSHLLFYLSLAWKIADSSLLYEDHGWLTRTGTPSSH